MLPLVPGLGMHVHIWPRADSERPLAITAARKFLSAQLWHVAFTARGAQAHWQRPDHAGVTPVHRWRHGHGGTDGD